MCCANF
jgi:MFS family permease